MSEANRGRQNQGYLYPNTKTSDKQPDYRGKVNVNGQEFLVSGWIRDKEGQPMISISLTDPATLPARPGQPQTQTQGRPPQAAGGSGIGDIFDDLPG